MKEELTIKNIQISKFNKLEDFKNKLIRCFQNISVKLSNESNSSFEIKIFKCKKSKEIFNLIITHSNKIKFYKINAEELKINSENMNNFINETEFFKNCNFKDYILIVEVLPKNMIVKPFIKIHSENIYCNQCQTKIISKDMTVLCENCSQVYKNIKYSLYIVLIIAKI